MKKFKAFLSVVLVALVFTACGTTETSTATYVLEQNGVESKLVFTYQGDKVLVQTTENTIPYSLINVTTKEEAEAIFDEMGASEYQGVDGITYSIDYFDDYAVEKLAIDYATLDYEKAATIPGIMIESGAEKNGVSMKKTEQYILSSGFEKVE